MDKSTKEDFQRFLLPQGDPGFSPERNKAVVDATIKKYEAYRKRKQKDFDEALDERVTAVADYLRHLAYGKNTSVEKYFGKKELAHLQARKIVGRLQENGAIKLSSLD